MIDAICAYLKNYFTKTIMYGEIRIIDGHLSEQSYIVDEYKRPLVFANDRIYMPDIFNKYDEVLSPGQYFRIIGSTFNDGVYQFPASGLTDEVFTGAIWAMAVPPAVMALSAEIDEWEQKNADALASPYVSESFGGYSYTRAGGYAGSDGSGAWNWQNQFASRLNRWKKVKT